MRFNVFSYLIKEGFKSTFKQKKMTSASIIIMCATMFIFGLFFVIGENVNHIITQLESQQGIQIFIDEDATDGESNDGINETSSMSDLELQSFNQKFAQYEGSQRGTTIMSLLQTVLSNNVSATDDSRKVEVTGDFTMSKDDTEAPLDSVDNSSTYNVQLEYTEGVVSKIIITQE